MPNFALEIEDLVKVYRARRGGLFGADSAAVRAVDGLSFAVPRGTIFGLLGPNGAGKTTLLKILSTLIPATSGRVRIEGVDVAAEPLEARRRISTVLQETAVEMFLSVRDNLQTFARFHGIETGEARQRADRVIELFGLGPEVERKVQDLSGGFRRRVQVAKVFMVNTPVLFLDEFSTGMDPILKRAVMESLRAEAARGRTIVLTTQILSEAEELCDDILILHKGRQVARGDLNTLKLLSQGVYEVAMTFDALPAGIEAEIARLHPLRQQVSGNTIEIALKAEEGGAIEIVAALAKKGRVLHVEIRGASLEDIFVELTQKA
ncbi:MAG TPA: ABC transporter ATP-binding protein [Candidatus Limnocylindrales bacterium]|nr:ABC transporter ATP-binding protein [Candidatus Limnocylindrales bacterium]